MCTHKAAVSPCIESEFTGFLSHWFGLLQVSALRMVDRERGQIDCLLNALAQDLPAKALPVVAEIISNHMDVLNYR